MDTKKLARTLKEGQGLLTKYKDNIEDLVGNAKKVYNKAMTIAATKTAKGKLPDIKSVLTGNKVADRALVEAAGVQAIIEKTDISLDDIIQMVYLLADLGGVFIGFTKSKK